MFLLLKRLLVVVLAALVDHPYYPLRTGYTYTMSNDFGEIITWEVLNVEGDIQVATAEIENIQFSTILNTDPIHFNGQTINGMLVRQDGDMGLTITKPQETTETGMSIGSEIQFGRGVGILRKTTFTEVGDITSELQAYYVP